MKLTDVQQHIKNKKFSKVYIFTGVEVGIRDIYIHQIVKLSGHKLRRELNLNSFLSHLGSAGIQKQGRVFLVVNCQEALNAKNLIKKLNEIVDKDIVIFTFSKFDKRSKFFKDNSNVICEFEKLNKFTLIKYAQKRISLSKQYSEELIINCDYDYLKIMNEVDKIRLYAKNHDISVENSYIILMDEGVLLTKKSLGVFNFVDAVLRNDAQTTFRLFQGLLLEGISPVLLLSVLYTGFRNLLLVQCNKNPDESNTGLEKWIINKMLYNSGYYNMTEIVENLRIIQDIEFKLKSGKIESEFSIPACLNLILRK